jgi:hypothetical protein
MTTKPASDNASWTSRLQRKEGDARKLAAARQIEATDSYPESQRAQQGASLQFYMTILFATVM